ncbi:unnamed protein product [marine sediment metagenome]|uniref:Uncharacterized protein n=1 Tax=marine sediment metagenome TaxID=412755 RepID=X0YKY2_9ZZZZ
MDSGDIIFYQNSSNLFFYYFIKDNEAKARIDDYVVMRGTDRLIETFGDYFVDLYTPKILDLTPPTPGEDFDWANTFYDVWPQLGLRSAISRIILGLVILLVGTVGIVMALASKGVQPGVMSIMVPAIILMILLTFVRLLPVWVPVVIAIAGASMGAFVAFMYFKS